MRQSRGAPSGRYAVRWLQGSAVSGRKGLRGQPRDHQPRGVLVTVRPAPRADAGPAAGNLGHAGQAGLASCPTEGSVVAQTEQQGGGGRGGAGPGGGGG